MKHTRRDFLARSLATAALARAPVGAATRGQKRAAPPGGMRLILLGTAGGPTPKITRAAPAAVVLVNGAAHVVDCGNGVGRQLRTAGVALRDIRNIFITHHHSDHNADYGTLLLLAWASDVATPVDTWGPPPLGRITRLFLAMSETDIAVRMADEGRPPLAPLVRPHEVSKDGVVFRDRDLTVTCARVNHPLVKDAFAYRFDSSTRSIVFSGDTSPSSALVKLAKDADVLVHEVIYVPAIQKLIADYPNVAAVRRHLLDSHTPHDEVGRIAAEANVKTLVLSHFVPGESTAVPDEAWREGAMKHFKGNVVVGKDLMEI